MTVQGAVLKYVIKKKDTDLYVNESGSHGKLEDAWPYPSLELALEEVLPDEEIWTLQLVAVEMVSK